MIVRRLQWPHIKGLYELYDKGQTAASIGNNAFVKHLIKQKRLIGLKSGALHTLVAKTGYNKYYEEHLLNDYNRYMRFLLSKNIPLDGRQRFDEYDLEAFEFIVDNKAEILASVPSQRQFSSMVFREKGSKYLDNHPGIASIVLNLLELDSFPGSDPKENQWRFVVDNKDAELIVLCENIANLKRAGVARANKLELWYVGGNNTAILEFLSADKLALPLLYCCDWDQHGIDIYKRIYQIFLAKGKKIQILTPYNQLAALPETSENHESRWKELAAPAQWAAHPYNDEQVALLSKLFQEKKWIEEESQDLLTLLQYNGFRE